MNEYELEPCMNCGRAWTVIEVYVFGGLRKYAAVCYVCGFRTAIFDKDSDARAVWNNMKDRVLAQACEAQFANPIEKALWAKMRKLEAENAKMHAFLRSSNLQFAGLQTRIAALEAALREIRDLAPAKTHYELSEMADHALNGEVKE